MFAKSLREYRRALIWWTIGLSAFVAMYVGIYGNFKQDAASMEALVSAKYPGLLRDAMGGFQDLASGAGFLQSVVYQLFVPLLFVVLATVLANRALVLPEESGTLELVITLPIERKRLVLDRFAGLLVSLLVVAVVTLAVLWAVGEAVELGVPFGNVVAAHLGVYLLALFFGTVALAVGAATGRRLYATTAVGVWVVIGYMVVTIGKDVAAVSWLKWVSPFHYYAEGRPVYEGLPVGDYLVLAGATAVLALTAVLAFDRRDVGV
ncbi:ABC transporter permease subunit [Nonomuraea sp. NN258]|uniref:ABC transporter permease subunit n=1 Tax=Nonomuraea antri TaxID=2730852 RepID=UPI001568C095|nr:ABC transporter permease subunit [Nonomuraea antri]NRQ32806.1 ABC transporter permease subunit [Nonomuraea antri]